MPEFTKHNAKLFKTAEEVIEPEVTNIQGTLPFWLNGSFLRVGPGLFDFESGGNNFTVNHWLDGYALLSKFDINHKNQTISFQSKFLQSDAFKKAQRVGKPLITEFGTKAYPDPAKNMFTRFFSSLMPEMSDNDSVSLYQLGSNLFATTNTQYFHKIDSKSLETCTKFDYHKCYGFNGVCVHPVHDPNTKTTYNLGFTISTGLKYQFIKISSSAANSSSSLNSNSIDDYGHETICTIPSRWSSSIGYFHSFGISTNYIIFIEQPYAISLTKAAKAVVKGSSFKDWLEWKPNEKCKFYVIEKSTGNILKTEYYSSEPFFFLHFINCIEDINNQIVIDIITYNSPAVLESMYLDKLRNNLFEHNDTSISKRFVLPLIQNINEYEKDANLVQGNNYLAKAMNYNNQTIVLTPELLSDYELELPALNRNYLCKDYKYFYGVCDANNCNNSNNSHLNNGVEELNNIVSENYSKNALCKVNVDTKKTLLWHKNEFYVPGEPIFIPNPEITTNDDNKEDSGIIISTVTDLRQGFDDFLVFLDAKNFEEIARATFKSHLPQAMHGIYLASDEEEENS